MAQMVAMRDAFGKALVELAARHPELVVLDGDLANSTKVDIFAQAVPDRFFQMGIAEQNMVGVAAGMALSGLRPVVSTFAVFLAKRALDQIRMSVAQTEAPVILAGGYSGLLTGKTGKTHIAVEDLAVFRAMPKMMTIAPADAVEMRQALEAALQHPGPVYLRLTRDDSPLIFGDDYRFRPGRAVLLRSGGDLGIVSTGTQTVRCLAAVDQLAAEGVQASLLHVPTLKPIDTGALVELARRCGRLLTAEEHSICGGLGSAVAEVVAEHHPVPVTRLGIQDTFGESGANDALLRKYGLDTTAVVAAARQLLTGSAAKS